MNTHIIISLKDIHNAKKTYSAYEVASNLMKLVENAKQISLSEEDIKQKALRKYPDYKDMMAIYIAADNELKREGYEQALKNLI
jgi:hypothetical protein